jgi:hypothetical protein
MATPNQRCLVCEVFVDQLPRLNELSVLPAFVRMDSHRIGAQSTPIRVEYRYAPTADLDSQQHRTRGSLLSRARTLPTTRRITLIKTTSLPI